MSIRKSTLETNVFPKVYIFTTFFHQNTNKPFFFCFLMTMVSKIKQNGVALFWNTQLVMKAFQNYSFFFWWDKNECAHSTQTLCFPQTHKMKLEFQNSLWLIFFFFFPAVCLESPLSKVCQISKWCVFVKLLFWMLVKL